MGRRSRAVQANRVARARLAELYARIPDMACRGLCAVTCTTIEMSNVERARIARAGVRILPVVELDPVRIGKDPCPALTADQRCSVYNVRPLICRIWGAVERVRCPHGCEPVGGKWLTDEDAFAMMCEADEIGGAAPGRERISAVLARQFMRDDPQFAAGVRRVLDLGHEADLRKAGMLAP